jgi:transposase
LPERHVDHPLGCHRTRIPDRVIFEKLFEVLVFGCAYWRIADKGCSATTLRRRRDEWIEAGAMDALEGIVRGAYDDRIVGLELEEVAVDCCITKAPCGGAKAGRSPVDRRKQGIKRSVAVDAKGIPLGVVTAPANRHDSPLLAGTLDAARALDLLPEGASIHLDRGYDSEATGEKLHARGLIPEISQKGRPAPVGATGRWIVERTNSWHNAHKKLAWCTGGNDEHGWSTSGWLSRTWLSSWDGSSEKPGSATAGMADLSADHDLLAQALRYLLRLRRGVSPHALIRPAHERMVSELWWGKSQSENYELVVVVWW